jgi:hypothetical protein
MGAPAGVTLRPLGIGEIIDRALTLYVQNFVLFSATVAVVIFVPLALGQYLLFIDQATEMRQVIEVLSHPGSQAPPVMPFAGGSLASFFIGIALFLIATILGLFANNAVAVSIGMLYSGRKPDLGSSLRSAFSRWPALVGLFFLAFLVLAAGYVAFVVTTFGALFGVAALFAGASAAFRPLAAIWIAAMFGLVPLAMLAAVGFFILLAIVFAFAGYGVVLEGKGAVDALIAGFGRIFNRKELTKAVVIGLVAILIGLGVSSVSGVGELLLGFLPGSRVLIALWASIFAVIAAAVQTCFYAVYYYDVRIRREGFDIEAALARLSPATS